MSFLDDIKEESYSQALTSGNLGKKKPAPDAVPFERFVITGHYASVTLIACKCGAHTRIFNGIYQTQQGDKGSQRTHRLTVDAAGMPNGNNDPIVTTLAPVSACGECIHTRGYVPDPAAIARLLNYKGETENV